MPRNVRQHTDFFQTEIQKAVVHNVTATPSSPTPVAAQLWYRSNINNGTGNGVLVYRDSSGNDISVATGGLALTNAYVTMTDGTTPTNAASGDTFKFRSSGTGLTLATISNDVTHGDNLLITLDSAVSGNNKVLLTNGSGKVAASVVQQVIALTDLTDVGSKTGTGTAVVMGTAPSLSLPVISGTGTGTAGQLGLATGILTVGDGSTALVYVTTTSTQTLAGKTLTTPTIASFVNANHTHLNAAGGGTITAAAVSDFDTQVRTSRLDQMAAPTTSVSMNSQRITNVLAPTTGTDAANRAFVEGLIEGRSWKNAVRVATTVAGTLASSFENADVVDGVTLATGDRILIKNQAAGAENGIYTVNATGAPTRALDADSAADLSAGFAVWVNEGTANADTGWVLTNDGTIVVGTTVLVFTQNSGLGQITAGAGMTKTGNVLNIIANANNTIVVNTDDISVSAALAAVHTLVSTPTTGVIVTTGSNTAAARSLATASSSRITVSNGDFVAGNATVDLASGIVTPGTYNGITVDTYGRVTAGTGTSSAFNYAADIGDGTTTDIVVTHSLGTKDIIVNVYDKTTPFSQQIPEIRHTSTTTVTLSFATAPTLNQYRVVIRA